MNIYRLITKGTCEERLIAIAEQKMYLDAMVVKKGLQSLHLTLTLPRPHPSSNSYPKPLSLGHLEDQSHLEGAQEEGDQSALLNAVRFGAKAIFDNDVRSLLGLQSSSASGLGGCHDLSHCSFL